MGQKPLRVAIALGTRPEAIKLAPVIAALRANPAQFETKIIATAQHREMLDQVLQIFGITPDVDLDLMRPGQELAELTSRVLDTMGKTLREIRPDLILVQGDTTTAMATAMAAYYERVPIAHVEAGLRTGDLHNPYPEEANRRLTGVLADLHFAPTERGRENLLAEAVPASRIVVTGNTVVDAVGTVLRTGNGHYPQDWLRVNGHRVVLLSSHRRESWGRDLENICLAVRDLVSMFPDIAVVYPVHKNPKVSVPVRAMLGGMDRVILTEPLDYVTFVHLMEKAYLIMTDSGGVQEEAPSVHKPLLVLRQTTERPEASEEGLSRVVGTSRENIVNSASRLLADSNAYGAMVNGHNPYGDGNAAARIVKAISRWANHEIPLLQPHEEFGVTAKHPVASAREWNSSLMSYDGV